MSAIPDGSALLRTGFVVLSAALLLAFVRAVYVSSLRSGRMPSVALRASIVAALLSGAWCAFTGILAARGMLRMWGPPTMGLVLAPMLLIAFGIALSPLGRRLVETIPVAWLVGFQGFRVLVELLLHRAYVEGLMPVQMSYAGRNFDIVTGLSALVVGAWLASGRRSRVVVLLWNTMGLALLLNVVVVALLSAPTPFRVFTKEPANVWITRAPWVWLPAVMVLAALAGHLLVYRWLWRGREPRRA
jgi:hypothetical protein